MRHGVYHRPVLDRTAVDFLITKRDGKYVDCTTGGGGHAALILQQLDPAGRLLGVDADPDAIVASGERLNAFPNKILRIAHFDKLDYILEKEKLLPVDGFLFDLGISSFQIDRGEKGFSFQLDGPLNMRFSPDQTKSAYQVVNLYELEQLERLFREWGEERYWKVIARKITQQRQIGSIESTRQLAELIRSVIPGKHLNKSLARIFQAIRIEVNDELERLKKGLEKAFTALTISGRMVVISYHSLEDRIVKDFFRFKESDCICPPGFPACVCDKRSEMRVLTRRPVKPQEEEIRENPRSRSARLRAAEKIRPVKKERQ